MRNKFQLENTNKLDSQIHKSLFFKALKHEEQDANGSRLQESSPLMVCIAGFWISA